MQKHRLRFQQLLCFRQRIDHFLRVVAVSDAEIGESEFFEKSDVLFLIARFELYENVVHPSDRGRNRHPVIVEDDEDFRIQNTQAVKSLVDESVIKRTISDKGDDVIILSLQIARLGDAERRGHRRSRVSRIITVVFALLALGKP